MLNGVDVSAFQSTDIPAGDFCIIKLTEGTGYLNSKAKQQAASARAKGQLVGFYHFPKYDQDPLANAGYFIEQVAKLWRSGDIVVLDHEAQKPYRVPTPPEASRWGLSWLKAVATALDVTPWVYSNQSWATGGYCAGMGGYPWWGAAPSTAKGKLTAKGPFSRIVAHQYSISGGFDRDVFYGTAEDWHVLAGMPKKTKELNVYGGTVNANDYQDMSFPHGGIKAVGFYSSSATPISVTVEVNHKTAQTTEKKTFSIGGPRLAKGGMHKVVYSLVNAADADAMTITNNGNAKIGWDAS